MLLPVKDDNPVEFVSFQYVTIAIIALCTLVYLVDFWVIGVEDGYLSYAAAVGGFHPGTLLNGTPVAEGALPPLYSIFASMFIHGGFWHFAGNMLFLWIFGDNVEDALGHVKYLAFYLISGIAAALAFAVTTADVNTVLIGASGAIAGVMGGYLVLYPKVWLWALLAKIIPLKVPAVAMIGLWFVIQFVSLGDDEAGVAWMAHIGGFIFGAALMMVLKITGQTHPIGADGRRIRDNRSFVPKVAR